MKAPDFTIALTDHAKWGTRLEHLALAIEADATAVMQEFCEDSEGMAEFELGLVQDEDGEYMWFAKVRWEGVPVSREDSKGDRSSPTAAVYEAIARLFRWETDLEYD